MALPYPDENTPPLRGVYYPTEKDRASANWTKFFAFAGVPDYPTFAAKAEAEPDWFWTKLIAFLDIRFDTPFTQVRDMSPGIEHARWCVGGRMNMTVSLLDRHVAAGRGAHEAILWESEDGRTRRLTYAGLLQQTEELAAGLAAKGIGAGDVIGLFMPMIPETAVAFLAIARLGAIVLPLFSGFGENALATRLNDSGAVAVITAEETVRRGKISPMKATLDIALAQAPSVRHVVVAPTRKAVAMTAGRDMWWDAAIAPGASFPAVIVDADHPMMVIYTSGTTGKPKGAIHTHCGFTVKTGEDYILCYDFKPSERWAWMTDIGWLVGPIQIVATLLTGATLLLAEGGPDYPQPGRLWRMIEDYKLTMVGVSPTTVRVMRTHGDGEATRYDTSSLRAILSTGEPWDEATWIWLYENVLRQRGPIMNNIGGTEMGAILGTNVLYPHRPTSFFGPVPGTGADIVDDAGNSTAPGEVGELVMREACIGTTRGLWQDEERYIDGYWTRFPGIWTHGDWASRDKDGLWYVHGRSDDTIKLAGKRTGPSEIEALLLATGKVKDAAAVAIDDPIKGSAVVCAVVAAPDAPGEVELTPLLSSAITKGLGGPYKPRSILYVSDLPRTRNGKVMRRVIRSVLTGKPAGDVSSLINPEAVDELQAFVGKV